MTRALVVEPAAEEDILDAYLWYEEGQGGLGSRFIEELDATFDRIVADPGAFREVEPGIRRSVAHTFPYLTFYTFDAVAITVVAVIHAAQDPAYIEARLGE
jgi:plasmid stabilization system protein ParE